MKRNRTVAIVLTIAGLIASAGVVAGQLPTSIISRHDTSADYMPQPGPTEMIQLILDWPAGVATAPHYHSGNVLNTVLAGEMTLRVGGTERRIGVGESWNDAPGVVHQALNEGNTPVTLAVIFVQPKGAMRTVNVPSLQSPGPSLPLALPNTGDGGCDDDPSACE